MDFIFITKTVKQNSKAPATEQVMVKINFKNSAIQKPRQQKFISASKN